MFVAEEGELWKLNLVRFLVTVVAGVKISGRAAAHSRRVHRDVVVVGHAGFEVFQHLLEVAELGCGHLLNFV